MFYCILKENNNIGKDEPLYIVQIISKEIGMKIPKIEYQIYYPLYNENELIKLNLAPCQGTKIDLSIAVKIDGKLDTSTTVILDIGNHLDKNNFIKILPLIT